MTAIPKVSTLLSLTVLPIVKRIKLKMLRSELKYEQKNRDYFQGMARSCHSGVRDCDYKILNIQHKLHRLEN